MNTEVIVTCAVTGAGETTERSAHVPVTPQQIAEAALEAAEAGASIAHVHVRDPETGAASRDPDLFAEVVERVRAAGRDVVLNLTSGMGGDLIVPDDDPSRPGEGSDLAGAAERLAHVEALRPEICTLDCGTMNFGDANAVVVQTPNILRAMAKRVQELGVKPELEVFDTGHLWFAKRLHAEGLIDDPPMFQICLGIPYGAPGDTASMLHMASQLPAGAEWAGFGIGRLQMPMVAQAAILGGHVRVGLEDNLYLEKGVLATNGQLVERAIRILELLGARVLTPAETRERLKLRARA